MTGSDFPQHRSEEDDGLIGFGGAFKCYQTPASLQSGESGLGLSYCSPEFPWAVDRRKHHIVIGLIGHEENVPNIAFWNPESASNNVEIEAIPPKVYLASTDIAGILSIWDVWTARTVFSSEGSELKFSGKLSSLTDLAKFLLRQRRGTWLERSMCRPRTLLRCRGEYLFSPNISPVYYYFWTAGDRKRILDT